MSAALRDLPRTMGTAEWPWNLPLGNVAELSLCQATHHSSNVRTELRARSRPFDATSTHRRELAADLHRQRIGQALGRSEDLSLLEFKTIEYERKGYVYATDEQLARIAQVPKRELMRKGVNQHTLEKLCRKEPVRVLKLTECLKVLEVYELEHGNQG